METFLGGKVTIHLGDVREQLRLLPDDSFDCVVTSPPYWGLRDYGVGGQIGLEPTLGEHLDVMVSVFREVRRVLKPTGTLWLNYGDCYATSPNGRSAAEVKEIGNDDRTFRDKPFSTIGPIGGKRVTDGQDREDVDVGGWGARDDSLRWRGGGVLKPKDLCMIPNRLAIALQNDGWWVRSEIIWHKLNPMPESSRDRPTSSHEKIWLLTKRQQYFYDADAIAEPTITAHLRRPYGSPGANMLDGREFPRGQGKPRKIKMPDGWDTGKGAHGSHHRNSREKGKTKIHGNLPGRDDGGRACNNPDQLYRNSRNVWTVGTAAFSEAHFATFPPEIAERCIKAGSPAGGSILDPFGGAGTTALVAASLGRTATLIELNPEYAELARARIEAAFMGREEGSRHMVKQLGKVEAPGPLFASLTDSPVD